MNYLAVIIMSRPSKDSKALNIKLDSLLYEKLEEHCNKVKRTKTAVVELALEEYLNKKCK